MYAFYFCTQKSRVFDKVQVHHYYSYIHIILILHCIKQSLTTQLLVSCYNCTCIINVQYSLLTPIISAIVHVAYYGLACIRCLLMPTIIHAYIHHPVYLKAACSKPYRYSTCMECLVLW